MQKASVYNKLYAVVSHLKASNSENATSYSEFLHKKRLDAFEVPSKGNKKQYCTPATIRKTISLAVKFRLISDESFELTSEGTAAAKSNKSFQNILAAQILAYLDDQQFGINQILATIDSISAPDLTEAATIFEKGKTDKTGIEEPEFRKLLHLLFLCERLDREIKHLYFRK